jgi:serine/threonine protein kinase
MVLQGVLIMPDRSLEQLRVGQQIGNYRLVRRLGQGGFAEVYLGQHLHLPVQAAIKLLLGAFDSPADNKKFRAEAQIVASLRHPHIVHILDFGIEPASQLPYLIMDYAPNGSLRQRHPRGTILALTTILSYLRQIASALDFAHRHNIVHRDVKPENMLLTDWDPGELDGRGTGSSGGVPLVPASDNDASPKILLSDFGIAVLTARNPEISLASVPGLAGTPAYMAPEQLRGKPVADSDQYSLAVVVCEWLCGQHPFRGTFPQIANQHINAFPPLPSERNPRISSALEDVVLTALSKAPSRCYPSVSDFANAFATAIQPPRRPASPIATAPSSLVSTIPPRAMRQLSSPDPLSQKSDPPTQPAPPQEPATKPVESRPRTRRALLLTFSELVVAGGISGGVLWFEDRLRGKQVGTSATSSSNPTKPSIVGKSAIAVDVQTTLYTFHGHNKNVLALAWSPRGDLIASGSLDKTVQVWHAFSGSIVSNYSGHADQVNTVAWSPDGVYVASGSNDKEVPYM